VDEDAAARVIAATGIPCSLSPGRLAESLNEAGAVARYWEAITSSRADLVAFAAQTVAAAERVLELLERPEMEGVIFPPSLASAARGENLTWRLRSALDDLIERAKEAAAWGPSPVLALAPGTVTIPHVETCLIGGFLCGLFGEVYGARSPRSKERNVPGPTARHRFVSAASQELGAGSKEPSAIDKARTTWTRFVKDCADYRKRCATATIGE
jgi:hypothetical protein